MQQFLHIPQIMIKFSTVYRRMSVWLESHVGLAWFEAQGCTSDVAQTQLNTELKGIQICPRMGEGATCLLA